jgi:hypothetical protein
VQLSQPALVATAAFPGVTVLGLPVTSTGWNATATDSQPVHAYDVAFAMFALVMVGPPAS